ncbi:MAG: PDZ domain-containing protein, partial [Kiritimatiellaeota bacterium]|nr:PDZ domain-containing protein [Kiritimatiellota bacterium]
MGFSDYLLAAPFVIFFFGFCIFIHELGHFLAAKWRGLHIVAFSIGFKKVWGFKHKGIDYRIGCIPIGGYVDLPQIDTTGDPKDENGNPLPPAKPIDKIITAFAGPFFNVLFGVFLSLFVWYYGIPQGTPRMSSIKVASVDAYSPEYKGGLREGDVITAVNGKSFDCTWNEFARKFIFAVKKVTLDVDRGGKRIKIIYQPIPNLKQTPREKIPYPFFLPEIPVKCIVRPDSPVARAGMRTGDVVVAVNGRSVEDFADFETFLDENDGTSFDLTISRGGKKIKLTGIKPNKVKTGVYQVGIVLPESLDVTVSYVEPPKNARSKSEKIKAGDIVLKTNGEVLETPSQFGSVIEKAKGSPIVFLLYRGGKTFTISKIFPTPGEKLDGSRRIGLKYKRSKVIWCSRVLPGLPGKKAGLKRFDRILSINGVERPSLKAFQKAVASSKGKPVSLVVE